MDKEEDPLEYRNVALEKKGVSKTLDLDDLKNGRMSKQIEYKQINQDQISIKSELKEDSINTTLGEGEEELGLMSQTLGEENEDIGVKAEAPEENSDSEESHLEDNELEESEYIEEIKQNNEEEYQSIMVKSYTSVIVKEEPYEDIKSIFKESLLELEKQEYHLHIFKEILETFSQIKLKDLQTSYIAKLREAACIEIFTCSLCNYQTMNPKSLSCHFKIIHNNKTQQEIFKCNKCDYETYSRKGMLKHLLNHKIVKNKKKCKNEKYPCVQCNYKARTEDALQKHLSSAHKDKTKCDLCVFQSDNKQTLKDHKDTHKIGPYFQCYKCAYKNGNKLTLALHLLRKHDIDTEATKRSKICEVCSWPCIDINKLRRHYLTHVNIDQLDDSQIHKCPEAGCNYQGKTKNGLILHMRLHKAPEFVCEICGFATKRKESYKAHLETHKKLSEIEWIPCPLCPYQGRSRKHLLQHMKIGVHDDKKRVHKRRRNLEAEGIVVKARKRRIKTEKIETMTSSSVKCKKSRRKKKPKILNEGEIATEITEIIEGTCLP